MNQIMQIDEMAQMIIARHPGLTPSEALNLARLSPVSHMTDELADRLVAEAEAEAEGEAEGPSVEQVAEAIRYTITEAAIDGELEGYTSNVVSYEEAGIMTRDQGVVIRLADGRTINVTITEGR